MNANIRAISKVNKHHFYGYYGINPWDKSGKYHLSLETDFHERRPEPCDVAKVGVIDVDSGEFIEYAKTSAFNLQQGSMLHWIDVGYGQEFTYNDWDGERVVSKAVNLETKKVRDLDGAIAGISNEHKIALGLSYNRMFACRMVVGYTNYKTYEKYPDDDGIFIIDLVTGKKKLIISIADIAKKCKLPLPCDGMMWLNHCVFNPDCTRIVFLTRIKNKEIERGFIDSMWMVDSDGKNLECQIDFGPRISHFVWIDNTRVLVSSNLIDSTMQFLEYSDGKFNFKSFGEGLMMHDAHASFSPDKRYIICDKSGKAENGIDKMTELIIYDPQKRSSYTVGGFFAPAKFVGDIRCDLHPRWSSDGKTVSFDSVFEGTRQVYLADISL